MNTVGLVLVIYLGVGFLVAVIEEIGRGANKEPFKNFWDSLLSPVFVMAIWPWLLFITIRQMMRSKA